MERVCSIFSQILKLVPRGLFDGAVAKHEGDKHTKGLNCWSQFIAMMFCHLGGARSLREIIGGLAASEGKLKHLGVNKAPARSTLSYANANRPWQVYRTVFDELVRMCQADAVTRKRKFRFKNPLVTLDSTMIPVCLSMFDWAAYVKTKGAVKMHMVLDNAGLLPQYAVITDGKTADIKVAKKLKFEAGAMLVFDRGYEDHGWWRQLTENKVNFVSRLKERTRYVVVSGRKVVEGSRILRDQEIELVHENNPDQPLRLRRIEVWLEDKQEVMVLVTNHMKLAATTIALIYKDRWQIELFFKAIKQALRIKTFVGTSENAVQIQIWTALIAMVLVKYLQLCSRWNWSLSNLVALLRQQLFVYRDLWIWLNQPFRPPLELEEAQLSLKFGG
jgi:Transposase DDE domain/Domain of unknown function (DUF4372)